MHSKLRFMMAFGFAIALCLVASLFTMPAVAGMNRWTAIGLDGANVVALAVDPRSPLTIFAGTAGSGVLKTTDGGASWTTTNGALPTVNVTALAIDPSTPSTVYVGTDTGLFKSTDGGQTWLAANGGLADAPDVYITAIAIDPRSPLTLYTGTYNGVFKSIDGAINWTATNGIPSWLTPSLIAIDPTTPSTIFVVVGDFEDGLFGGVFKSGDAGMSWSRIYGMDPVGGVAGAPAQAAALVIDPRSPTHLYLALYGGGVVRSKDGGTSWSSSREPPGDLSSLAIDPAAPATLYAGSYSGVLFQTSDGGDHWTPVTGGPPTGVSINAIALAAPATIYTGGGIGVFRSVNSGQAWIRLTLGIRSLSTYPIAVDPTNSSTIYTAVGGAIARTTDGGVHWNFSASGPSFESVTSLVIDPASPATIFAGGSATNNDGASVYKSIDGGAHWVPASNGLLASNIQALAIAPSLNSTLYAGEDGVGVLKSIDGGTSWTTASNGLTAAGNHVSALAVDPTNASAVFVAMRPTGRPPDTYAKIFKSTDGAGQWRQVPIAVPTGAWIMSLAVDPATPSTVYAAYALGNGGVLKSMDSGETWIASRNGIPDTTWVVALAIDPAVPSRIYAGTPMGIFRSTDGAANWTPFNSGLPNEPDTFVWYLSVDRTGALLRAATSVGEFEYENSGPQSPGTVAVIEYVNASLGDYFITARPDEINLLDRGAFAGWTRTGYQFNAFAGSNEESAPVCRFFSDAFGPKSTHFYSPFFSECTMLQATHDWSLETSNAFDIGLPVGTGESCATGFLPVYRLYNNSEGGVPNHRYTTNLIVREQMIARGWAPEGTGPNVLQMCSPP